MAKVDPFSVLYCKKVSALDFKWDTMVAPPLLSLISPQDIYALNQIATSNRLASDPDEKYRLINNILAPRGFKKIASGTNRVAYKYLENQDLCLKVAIDRVGLKDNPCEFQNQFKLKPFVVRLFEISPCGTVALEERVEPLVHIEEYINIIDDVFNFIVEKVIGKYVVDDIGTEYWQNLGIRKGFGPVLLDFPYVYELDGAKIRCNRMNPDTHEYCLGEIDYDDGFNHLVCSKCGKSYFAKQLGKQVEKRSVIIDRKGEIPAMSIKLMRGNTVVKEFKTEHESAIITQPKEEQLPKVKVKNRNKFEKRQAENKKKEENREQAIQDASKRYDERMQRQVEEGLKNLHEGSSEAESSTNGVRTVTLGELSGDPNNYLLNGRFKRADLEEEKPRTLDISKQDDTLTVSMGDILKQAGVITQEDTDAEKINNMAKDVQQIASENSYDLRDTMNVTSDNTVSMETVNIDVSDIEYKYNGQEVIEVPVEDPDDENVKYLNGKKFTKIETEKSEDEEVTDEIAKNSSWDNPVKCQQVTIDLEEDDSVLGMY